MSSDISWLSTAAVLIVLLLGAISVDHAIAFLGEREAASLAAAAANDAATAGIDLEAFRADGSFHLDDARARRIALGAVSGSSTELHDVTVEVAITTVDGADAVRVTVRGTADYVFAPVLPGGPSGIVVESTATAVARVG